MNNNFLESIGRNLKNKIDDFIKKINKQLIFKITNYTLLLFAFNMIYRQGPLYNSNQHTKFLHGLASAGFGYLKNDWLANTIDPLPVFSFLVFFTYKFLHEYFFYLYFIIIVGFYLFSLLKINYELFNYNDDKIKKIIFITIICLFHSTVLFDSLTYKFFHIRILSLLFEEGVAGQYLIGRLFQPNVFGVFLLFSIYLFYKDRYYSASIFLTIASIFHSAYLFSSAILILSYIVYLLIYKKDLKTSFLIGILSLILILPVLIYNFIYLGPTSQESLKKSLDIIVNYRIPQHSIPLQWINFSTFIKIALVTTALIIIRKSKLFLIILIPFLSAVILTIREIFVTNNFINFIHPWRVSVWLVPLSTSIIIGYLVSFIKKERFIFSIKLTFTFSGIIIFLLIISGFNGFIKQFNLYLNKDHGPMMNYVKENKNINDLYLIPPDMTEFRLDTGVPVLVTDKSHPYKDIEIIEWYNRIILSKNFYSKKSNDKTVLLNKLINNYKITHIVMRQNKKIEKNNILKEIYKDKDYIIYKINN